MGKVMLGFEWGAAFTRVAADVQNLPADWPADSLTPDVIVDRYVEVAQDAKEWCLQQLQNLPMYPQPAAVASFGVRMICYGILVGSASSQEDDDSVVAGVFNKMATLGIAYPEDEVAPAYVSVAGEENDRATFTDHVLRSLLGEEPFEDLAAFMAWGCELAALGVMTGNRASKDGA